MAKKKIRHILGVSGGKDSTGLAILLHKIIPNLEFFFCDTKKELPETYAYLNRIETRFGIKIKRLGARKGFDEWLEAQGGYLPSARARWCTKQLKIKPLEEFVGNDMAYSYVGIRADEDRTGYLSTQTKIKPVYVYKAKDFTAYNLDKLTYSQPAMIKEFKNMGINLPIKEDGYCLTDVKCLITDSGIGMPAYYSWRTRSGCFFCFFQRKFEWVMLAEKHPDLFDQAKQYESHEDGRIFTWCQGETLDQILARKDQIKADYKKRIAKEKANAPNKPLIEALEAVLNKEDLVKPCIVCTL